MLVYIALALVQVYCIYKAYVSITELDAWGKTDELGALMGTTAARIAERQERIITRTIVPSVVVTVAFIYFAYRSAKHFNDEVERPTWIVDKKNFKNMPWFIAALFVGFIMLCAVGAWMLVVLELDAVSISLISLLVAMIVLALDWFCQVKQE
jgi:cytochrome bd-type quinol oxidase subunit 2